MVRRSFAESRAGSSTATEVVSCSTLASTPATNNNVTINEMSPKAPGESTDASQMLIPKFTALTTIIAATSVALPPPSFLSDDARSGCFLACGLFMVVMAASFR